MKTILNISFILAAHSGASVRGLARKEFQLPFAPTVGMEINTPAWKEGRQVGAVTLNLDEGDLFIYLDMGEERRDSEEALASIARVYKDHGWDVRFS
jgi:hypothetical protein